MRNTLETRLGIFAALTVIAALLVLETIGTLERFQRGDRFYALFSNIQDLKEGDRVKMAGVDVGRVEKIDFAERESRVRVAFKVKPRAKVRTDSVAMVKFTGLMGQNFVSLDFGKPGSPLATPGTVLKSEDQPDLGEMMSKINNVAAGLDKITSTFSGDKIDNVLGPLIDILDKNKVPITATIANMRDISKAIAEGQGTVGKLIYDKTLYDNALVTITNLQDAGTEIKMTVADARKVVDGMRQVTDQVNSGQGTVGKLLKDESLYRETTASMTNLREILQKVNQGQGSAGKIVNDPDLYKNAKLTLQKLDKATEGLEDQGPLSIMGLLVNSLF